MGEAVTACGFCDQGVYRGKPCPYCKGISLAPQAMGEAEWIETELFGKLHDGDCVGATIDVVRAADALHTCPTFMTAEWLDRFIALNNALAALRSQVEGQ